MLDRPRIETLMTRAGGSKNSPGLAPFTLRSPGVAYSLNHRHRRWGNKAYTHPKPKRQSTANTREG
ncbi:MAG TPA: hypothetical protein V6D14_25480 [Coleofasciculaceae cyanobacterium]